MKQALLIVSFCASVATSYHCNESLPVHVPPLNVLSTSLGALSGASDTVLYMMFDYNNPNQIPVTLSTPPLGFEVKVVNVYDETIQDDAEVSGTLELEWIDKPDFKATLNLLVTGIVGSHYDPKTKLITLNPGDTLRIRTYWNYRLSNNDWAFSKQQAVDGPWITGGGDFFRFHNPMRFRGRIKMKLFRSLALIESVSSNEFVVNFKGRIFAPP